MRTGQPSDSDISEQESGTIPKFKFEKPEAYTGSIRAASEITNGLEEYSGEWTSIQAGHLLRRTMFGIKKNELDTFSSQSMSDCIDQLIQASPLNQAPVNHYDINATIDTKVAWGETFVESARASSAIEGHRVAALKAWQIDNILTQEATIQEKMNLFWMNLLPSPFYHRFDSRLSYLYFKTIHNNALGNFKTLIKNITLDPSMLYFLNGSLNRKEAPDENYARELQELFCIGKGPNANYTEEDVREAARILTGYKVEGGNIDGPDVVVKFYPALHDSGLKKFSSFYGNTEIGGEGSDGQAELDELIDMIFDNDETALYISRRLYRFFVFSDISQSVEDHVIQPMASKLRENYEIAPVLKELFKSSHFYNSEFIGAQIKSPLDYLIGYWRTTSMPEVDDADEFIQYHTRRTLFKSMGLLGMEIGDPPSVSGWPPYYQKPQFDKLWITADSITRRTQMVDSAYNFGLGFKVRSGSHTKLNLPLFIKEEFDTLAGNPDNLVNELSKLFIGLPLEEKKLTYLKNVLIDGEVDNHDEWSETWDKYLQGDETVYGVLETRLISMFQALVHLPEFQLI